jgi:hypothetical protein
VANKQDYLARLQVTVQQLHNCGAVWRESVPVTEIFGGKTIWKGEVEVFDLTGHPKAKRAYGWSHPEGDNNKGERFVTVLEIPPVDSPETAVKMAIYNDIKQGKLKPK